nr:hypothetical protein [Allomuricauda sp.]
MRIRRLALCALSIWALTLVGCGKDDSPVNTNDGPDETFYNITAATINTDAYTAPGTLSFRYSVDNGETYTVEKPEDLSKGDELWVKINNGEVDIFEEDFYFDWSNSSLAPADAESDLAKFVVKESDITLAATVTDKLELLVSQRDTGQFFVLDLSDGGLTPAFTILEGELALDRVRGAIYNYNDGNLYVSTAKFNTTKSQLHKVNLQAKQSSTINDNPDSTWEGIADLVITEENKILATIGFGGGQNPAIIEFGLDGSASEHILISGDNIPVAGLGLTASQDGGYLIGDAFSTKIHRCNASGEIAETINLVLQGFEEDADSGNFYIKNLIQTSDALYAICLEKIDNATQYTYVARVDLENEQLTYLYKVSTHPLQFNALVQIPAYAF